MKIKRYGIILLLLMMVITGHAQTGYSPDSILLNHHLVGFSLLAVHNGEVIVSEHRGLANIATGKPIDNRTLFRFASVSKTVTSMAFMILEQEGLAGLDDDVSDILGYRIENPHHPGVPVTPRMLMSHTSSLLDGPSYLPFLLNETYENPQAPDLKELITGEGAWFGPDLWHQAPPGSFFNYSNLAYGLLGTVIEKVSGQRFDLFVKERILLPLGIRGGYNVRDIEDITNIATLYRMTGDEWVPQADHYPGGVVKEIDFSAYSPGTNALLFGPQGGLRISAEDLSKIMILLMNGGVYHDVEILQPASVDKMRETQWLYDGSNGNNNNGLFNSWGLGLFLSTMKPGADVVVPGFRMRGHAGQAYGLLSGMYFHNDPDFGIIFAINGRAGPFSPGQRSALYLEEEALIDFLFHQAIAPLLDD